MRPPFDFVAMVVAERDLVVTSSTAHTSRVEPRRSDFAWHCDLDDGTPTGENDPASFVRWVCPDLRTRRPSPAGPPVTLDVHRAGPASDLGRLAQRLARLAGHAPGGPPAGSLVVTDPHGVLDPGLRQRLEGWPPAMHGDGVVRPAELSSIGITAEGLVVSSVSWWGSAPALRHQVDLAVDVAHRLAALR